MSEENSHFRVIPRSRSDFCYVGLTPKEKRKTTDFSLLLPQFHWDFPSGYSRLMESGSTVIKQPTTNSSSGNAPKMSRSVTGSDVPNITAYQALNPEVMRSQSMRSLRLLMELSPKLTDSKRFNVSSYPMKQRTTSNYALSFPHEDQDYQRLRNFSVTPKGIVNWGDSFRSRSIPCMVNLQGTSLPEGKVQNDFSRVDRNVSSSCHRGSITTENPSKYNVTVVGGVEVGKTSLIQQFLTSECTCSFDNSNEESQPFTVGVVLNDEESELKFVDCPSVEDWEDEEDHRGDEEIAKGYDTYAVGNKVNLQSEAHLIVYSVTNRGSYVLAEKLLSHVQKHYPKSAVILVGNKIDLERVRAITTDEGRILAKERGCKFIETSVAINHQVDELLVGLLSQIRMKTQSEDTRKPIGATGRWSYSEYSIAKAKGVIKKFLKKACFQSKSCDNLQCL